MPDPEPLTDPLETCPSCSRPALRNNGLLVLVFGHDDTCPHFRCMHCGYWVAVTLDDDWTVGAENTTQGPAATHSLNNAIQNIVENDKPLLDRLGDSPPEE